MHSVIKAKGLRVDGKNCSKCKQYKVYSKYSKDKRKKDGYMSQCKECSKLYNKKYSKRNYLSHLKYKSKMSSGVYKLTTRDGIYIGESITMKYRVIQHFSDKSSPCLGKEVLKWEVLEYIEDPVLRLQREQYYIDKYNPELNILKS